jgi:hypothetical protein
VERVGAARIPLDLVESVTRLMPRERVSQSIAEVQGLVRRVRVRRYRAWKP